MIIEELGDEKVVIVKSYDQDARTLFILAITMDGMEYVETIRLCGNMQWHIEQSLESLGNKIRAGRKYREALQAIRRAQTTIDSTEKQNASVADTVKRSMARNSS